jgi:hypothetical protein
VNAIPQSVADNPGPPVTASSLGEVGPAPRGAPVATPLIQVAGPRPAQAQAFASLAPNDGKVGPVPYEGTGASPTPPGAAVATPAVALRGDQLPFTGWSLVPPLALGLLLLTVGLLARRRTRG